MSSTSTASSPGSRSSITVTIPWTTGSSSSSAMIEPPTASRRSPSCATITVIVSRFSPVVPVALTAVASSPRFETAPICWVNSTSTRLTCNEAIIQSRNPSRLSPALASSSNWTTSPVTNCRSSPSGLGVPGGGTSLQVRTMAPSTPSSVCQIDCGASSEGMPATGVPSVCAAATTRGAATNIASSIASSGAIISVRLGWLVQRMT